jgi:preprotein translocase subunit SecA
MSAPKAKKTKTEPEDASDTVDDQDIQVLESIQEQIEELNDKATEEILEVERKYNRLRKPLYERRNQAIRKIPEFWVKVVSYCDFHIAQLSLIHSSSPARTCSQHYWLITTWQHLNI